MSQTESPKLNQFLTFIGIASSILIFAVILYVAYLPGRPAAVDSSVGEKRLQTANEARAAGLAKITVFEVVDAESGIVRIPIQKAMDLTVSEYQPTENPVDQK